MGELRLAILGNISQLEHTGVGTTLENQLVLTLMSVEEEAALKNGNAAAARGDRGAPLSQPEVGAPTSGG